MSEGNKDYLALLEEMRLLHIKKTRDYGTDKDPLANLRASEEIGIEPWVAAWLRAKDKVQRINSFCRNGCLANEGVEDSLMDLAAYCLLALVLRREMQLKNGEVAHKAPRMIIPEETKDEREKVELP